MFRLKEVADIRAGYSFRSGISHRSDGNASVIQLSNVNERNFSINDNFSRVLVDSVNTDHFLQPNDIILTAKGNNFFACLFTIKSRNILASSAFLVLRIKADNILPEYLAWYLNQKPAQDYMSLSQKGTHLPHLSKSALQDMPLKIPELNMQKKISAVGNLYLKEIEICKSIMDKRKIFIEQLLLNSIKA